MWFRKVGEELPRSVEDIAYDYAREIKITPEEELIFSNYIDKVLSESHRITQTFAASLGMDKADLEKEVREAALEYFSHFNPAKYSLKSFLQMIVNNVLNREYEREKVTKSRVPQSKITSLFDFMGSEDEGEEGRTWENMFSGDTFTQGDEAIAVDILDNVKRELEGKDPLAHKILLLREENPDLTNLEIGKELGVTQEYVRQKRRDVIVPVFEKFN